MWVGAAIRYVLHFALWTFMRFNNVLCKYKATTVNYIKNNEIIKGCFYVPVVARNALVSKGFFL